MTTSRALMQRILVPMVRVTADGLARLGLEPAPEAWDDPATDPFAVPTDGVRSTYTAAPAEAVAIALVNAATALGPDVSAESAGAVSATAANAPPSPQRRDRDNAVPPRPGDRAPDDDLAMHDAAALASASAKVNGHPADAHAGAISIVSADQAAMPGPNASTEPAGAVSATAANALPSPYRRSRGNAAAPRSVNRAPDHDLAMFDAAARASPSVTVNGHLADAPAVGEAASADTDLTLQMRVRRTALTQSAIRLPPPAPLREAGGAELATPRTSKPECAPHAANTHAALDPGHRPSVTRTSDANGIDAAVRSISHNEHALSPPHAMPLPPGRIPVQPVAAAPRHAREESLPRNSGSFAGIVGPSPRGTGTVPGHADDPGGLPADGTMNGADPLRDALSPIVRAAPPALDNDTVGPSDDGLPTTAGRPQVRSTVNVNVAIGSADAAAAWNAADPAVRESLRDALIEILRDDARRQGIDL